MEVLISVTILSIGLLGIAGLQVKGLRYTQSAFYSSQATSLAYAIADSIHANPNGDYTLGTPPSTPPIVFIKNTKTPPNCLYTPLPPLYLPPPSPPVCSPNNVAAYDIHNWLKSFSLPKGEALIDTTAKPKYTITIRWDDNRDGAVTPAEEYEYRVRIGS